MRLNKKNLGSLFLILAFSMLIGALIWELMERILNLLNINLALSTSPIQLFDIYVMALTFRANPGMLLGAAGGFVLFKNL